MQDKLSADTLDDLRVNPESGPFTARRERHGYEASMTPREILSVSQTEGLSAVSPNEEDAPDEDDGDLGAAMRVRLKRIERIRTSEGSERLKFVAAISEIVELLSVTHTEVALWLLHLVSALRDLDLGRIDPLFVPNKIDSRPPDATRVWYARAMVAAAAQSLIDHFGITRTEAAEEIAEEFSELRNVVKSRASLPASIESWRNEFRKRRVKNRGAHHCYCVHLGTLSQTWAGEGLLKTSKTPAPDRVRQSIQIILEGAAERARELAHQGLSPHSSP